MPEWITFFGSHRRAHAALTLDIGSYVAEPRVRAPYSASGFAGKPRHHIPLRGKERGKRRTVKHPHPLRALQYAALTLR